MPACCVNPVGSQRQATYEELLNRALFLSFAKKPDRTDACLRNSPLMTLFDHMGMFEVKNYNQREMIERQQADVLTPIATVTDMAVNQRKAFTKKHHGLIILLT